MENIQNHIIVLFKNKVKKKIIKKFKTLERAEKFYNSLMDESNDIIFSKQYENGVESNYELALLSPNTDKNNSLYIKDDFGRQIKVEVEDSNYQFKKLSPYFIDEYFVDYSSGQKINTISFIKKYLDPSGLKLVSKLNNKIIVQNDDVFKLFTFKNDDDSSRFIDSLSSHFLNYKRMDCMFVKDYDTMQRKYLYNILTEKGFPKSYLFRHSTTHPIKK
jgi:hypothetical protein